MTLEQRIIALATAIGSDVKLIKSDQGQLTALNTTTKSNIVDAINEVLVLAKQYKGPNIDDSATTGTDVIWSVSKISSELSGEINTAITQLRLELTNGASEALDTFKELADALNNDPSFATTIATSLNNRVRFDDAQTLTPTQKKQACDNIGVGNPDKDFVAEYTTAKGA